MSLRVLGKTRLVKILVENPAREKYMLRRMSSVIHANAHLKEVTMERDSKYAPNTKRSENALFSPMFIIASIACLSLNRLSVSSEYVEKVVNAPRNPTATNNLVVDDTGASSDIPKNAPINSEPTALTHKVPHGKPPGPTPWAQPEMP